MRSDPEEPLYSDMQQIRKAAERSADLTRQLLAFARRQTVAPKVLDLNDTVEGMLKMLRRLIGENIELVWRPGQGVWQVKMDPSQVDQILANLCVNSRDAIAGVGRISIETRPEVLDEAYCAGRSGVAPGQYVLICVSDDGNGMDPETLDKLFEPFFTTKAVGQGTGLGLATVYGIVQQNNGFINVYSEPGKGTSFSIYLPRYKGEERQAKEEERDAPVPRGRETILLAEDEPVILEMTANMLEHFGYTVLTAGTPQEAIHKAKEHQGSIHLLMTDVVMPEMNGRDLAQNILNLYPDIRCLFMSGYTADIIAHQGVLNEGVYFIQKPFSMSKLADKVREALA
jgi:CheY-like chemotaxis protein